MPAHKNSRSLKQADALPAVLQPRSQQLRVPAGSEGTLSDRISGEAWKVVIARAAELMARDGIADLRIYSADGKTFGAEFKAVPSPGGNDPEEPRP